MLRHTIIAALLLLTISAFSQSGTGWTQVQGKRNYKDTQYFTKDLSFPGSVTLSATDITGFKATTARFNDTLVLSDVAALKADSNILYPSVYANNAALALKSPIANPTFTGRINITHTYTGNYIFGNGGANLTTGGENNVLIGLNAGNALTKGQANIAIGRNALYTTKTGYFNTAVGYGALFSMPDGSHSGTAVGYNALNKSTGNDNTAVGKEALTNHTTTGGNTAVGSQALITHTTGLTNTALGFSAGYSNSTGIGNIFIGAYAGYYETGHNKLFIDNASRTDEATARTSALIYGIMDATPANQILTINAVLKLLPLADPPSTATEGMIYADTDHHIYYYNGTTWKQLDN